MPQMTVAQLIAFLQTQPQDLPVAYRCYSELILLEPEKITIGTGCTPWPDGWIESSHPDTPQQSYLIFPGD